MQSIKELISSITDGSRAAHAFVIEGQNGEARSEFLSSLAAGLLCSHPDPAARPCGRCPACRQVAAGTSPDVIRMTKSISSGRSGRETYKTDRGKDKSARIPVYRMVHRQSLHSACTGKLPGKRGVKYPSAPERSKFRSAFLCEI